MEVYLNTIEQMGSGLFFLVIESKSGRSIKLSDEKSIYSGAVITKTAELEYVENIKNEVKETLKKKKHIIIDTVKYNTKEELIKKIKGMQNKNYHCHYQLIDSLKTINNKETEELFNHIPTLEDSREFLMKQYKLMTDLLDMHDKKIYKENGWC